MSEPLAVDSRDESVEMRSDIRRAVRRGLVAAVFLAVLTVIEFYIAVGIKNPLYVLLPFVALKGWVILDAFMHVKAVFGRGGH